MPTTERAACPDCGQPVRSYTRFCAFCGADMAWLLQQRRANRQSLRVMAVVFMVGVLLSMVILIPSGVLAAYPRLVAPMWIAAFAVGLALWLMGDNR